MTATITLTDQQVDVVRRALNLTSSGVLATALHDESEWVAFAEARTAINTAASDAVHAERAAREVGTHQQVHRALNVELGEQA